MALRFADSWNGIGQTIGAVTVDLITIPVPLATVIGILAFTTIYQGAGPNAQLGQLSGVVQRVAGGPVVTGSAFAIIAGTGGLAATAGTIVVSGNNVILRYTGVAGLTLQWMAQSLSAINYTP